MFPSILNTFARPSATDRLNNPSHSALHNTVSSALGQVEATIGITGANSVVGTLMYDVRSPASGGGGHVQSANKGGTGQTTYAKGDILVAQSASVLAKVTVGQNNYFLMADSSQAAGVKWNPVPVANVQSFISTGTWTKPNDAKIVFVTLVGAGGGGASATGNPGGGGGGGGALVNQAFTAPDVIQSSLLVLVSSVTAAGAKGADTSFGVPSLLVAGGGAPGAGGNGGGGGSVLAVAGIAGSPGGAGGTPSFNGSGGSGGGGAAASGANGPGTAGGNGSQNTGGTAGVGGSVLSTLRHSTSILGYGGNGTVGGIQNDGIPRAGSPGSVYGGGGGGGSGDLTGPGTGTGGTGAGGYAIITTFI